MELKEVVSSNIRKVGYEENYLIVEYNGGAQYKYKDVPQKLYEQLLESESKGRFINSEIKGKYDFEKVVK